MTFTEAKSGGCPRPSRNRLTVGWRRARKGRTLVAWLNAVPEVRAVVAAEFAGKPIRGQNLSDWRNHGYQQRLMREQAWKKAQEMTATASQPVTDEMAGWVTAHYLLAIRKLLEKSAGGELDLKTLRHFLHAVVAVRRGDHRAARLERDRERGETRAATTETRRHREDKCRDTRGEL